MDSIDRLSIAYGFHENLYTSSIWRVKCTELWHDYGEMKNALVKCEQTINAISPSLNEEQRIFKISDFRMRKGDYYYKMGDIDKSLIEYQFALDVLNGVELCNSFYSDFISSIYVKMADSEYKRKNIHQSIQYLEHAIQMKEEDLNSLTRNRIYLLYVKIASMLMATGEKARAEQFIIDAEERIKEIVKRNPSNKSMFQFSLSSVYAQLGMLNNKLGRHEKIIEFINAIESFGLLTKEDQFQLSKIKLTYLLNSGKTKDAISLYNHEIKSKFLQNITIQIDYESIVQITDVLIRNRQHSIAIDFLNRALSQILYPAQSLQEFTEKLYSPSEKAVIAFDFCNLLGKLYLDTKQESEAEKVLSQSHKIATVVSNYKYLSGDKEQLLVELKPMQEQLIRLWTLQKNKSLNQLFQDVNIAFYRIQNQENSNSGSRYQDAEIQKIDFYISELEKKKYYSSQSDSRKYLDLRLFELNEKKKNLIEKVNHVSDTGEELQLLNSIQNSLKENEVLLQLISGTDFISVFKVTKQNTELMQFNIELSFEDNFAQLMQCIRDRNCFDWRSQSRNFALAIKLDSILSGAEDKDIVWYGDGYLSEIPMDILVLSDGKLLIEKFAHRALFQLPTTTDETQAVSISNSYFFAPSFYQSSEFNALDFNEHEINKIQAYFAVKKFYKGQFATIENLLSNSPSNSILHLATHAQVDLTDPRFSFLVLHDNHSSEHYKKLFYTDLSYSNLPYEMVVLNGCETGTGSINLHQGINSIASAFYKAGTKSVLSTSWSVNDQSSCELMLKFYQFLFKGFEKDKALQMAKLEWLENTDPLLAHPFYWSGLQIQGADTVLKWRTEKSTIFAASLLGLFTSLLIFYRRQKSS
ncbi:MAG TPA: CHAT domain-containing protein [Saprospiraceae bacterium]|nr:CHAT domain-containing protein [Saprospiraceae bacterium]